MSDVSEVLNRIEKGEAQSASRLLPLVYQELRRLAAQKLAGEAPGQTLQATALVHEAYARLVGSGSERPWQSRGHFFAAAAEAMRRILVEKARRKGRLKRGGNLRRVDLQEAEAQASIPSDEIVAVNEALEQFAAEDPQKAELVKLRFFAGLSVEEAAHCLGISRATADRYWAYARAWLYDRIHVE